MKLRRFLVEGRWRDAWLPPGEELVAGCVLLVLSSSWFWESIGAIWENWHNRVCRGRARPMVRLPRV
jgi:hypothetical protein